MARRIDEVPDDADWPDLEDHLIPDQEVVPGGGPFEKAFHYLHGARVTLDAGLMGATRLLTVTAARSTLRVADEQDVPIPPDKAERFEAIANGAVSEDQDELLEVLWSIAAFLETNMSGRSANDT